MCILKSVHYDFIFLRKPTQKSVISRVLWCVVHVYVILVTLATVASVTTQGPRMEKMSNARKLTSSHPTHTCTHVYTHITNTHTHNKHTHIHHKHTHTHTHTHTHKHTHTDVTNAMYPPHTLSHTHHHPPLTYMYIHCTCTFVQYTYIIPPHTHT